MIVNFIKNFIYLTPIANKVAVGGWLTIAIIVTTVITYTYMHYNHKMTQTIVLIRNSDAL